MKPPSMVAILAIGLCNNTRIPQTIQYAVHNSRKRRFDLMEAIPIRIFHLEYFKWNNEWRF